jgi:hypothetical protein
VPKLGLEKVNNKIGLGQDKAYQPFYIEEEECKEAILGPAFFLPAHGKFCQSVGEWPPCMR